MTYYKVISNNQTSCHGGNGTWQKKRWREVTGPLVPCRNGIHFCRRDQLVRWLGPTIWVFEDGSPDETIDGGDKMVTRRGRIVERLESWDDRAARLFAADCAEAVLPIFEREQPGDDRPRLAIAAARAYANGEIDDADRAAARAAARDAAWAADREAAWAAAWAAAGAADRAADRAAAGAAAWAADRDAAWAAARAAAGAADRAATWAATRAAAGAAQTESLFSYLGASGSLETDQ